MAVGTTKGGALNKKTKVLIVLAIDVSSHCDTCSASYHNMGLIYATEAVHAYEEFLKAQSS